MRAMLLDAAGLAAAGGGARAARARRRASCCSASAPAASAAPTCTSSTASSREPKLPLVPGHQIVGEADDGRRLGVPWLGWTCGECRFCTSGRENLCDRARFTGYDLDGGYAEWAVADERFCFPIPDGFGDLEAAPLLCAGLIGYRSLRLAGDAERLGLYGFGAAAHIVAQVARGAGPARVRGHARGRRRGAGVRALARRRVGRRRARRPRSSTRRSSSRRPASSSRPRSPRSRRAARSSAPGSTCPTSRRSRTSCSGASASSARSRTSRAATPRSSSRSPRACRCGPRSRRSRSRRANEALAKLRSGAVRGALVLVP